MNRYEELEKLYYKKRNKKIIVISIMILVFILVIFFIYKQQINNTKHIPEKKLVLKEVPKKIEKINLKEPKIIKEKIIKKVVKEKNNSITKKTKISKYVKKLVLYPIFPDITETKVKKKVVKENKIIKSKPKQKKIVPIIKNEDIEVFTEPQKTINITVSSSRDKVTNLIDSYNNSPTFEVAMNITKLYFKKKNYNKSIEWAKKANKIKPENYESWYIFAKSLVKLGNTKKAKLVLKAYMDSYGSNEKIIEFLRSIK